MSSEEGLMILCYFIGMAQGFSLSCLWFRRRRLGGRR